MKRLTQILVIGALVAVLTVPPLAGFSTLASAQVPRMINYQGKLTTPAGAPVNDTLQMVFTIYADSGGTNLLWTETQDSVVVEKGVFNVLLGSVDSIPYSVFDGPTRYLGVKVGDDPEITPRKPMMSVAYAYKSIEADTADFARAVAGGGGDNDWVFPTTAGGTNPRPYVYTFGPWGIARYGNVLYGIADSTHVNLGVACTTGTVTGNYVYCTIGGGHFNTASDHGATVGGGYNNTASDVVATVGGGSYNIASTYYATVAGGTYNTASGQFASTVGGGEYNSARGQYDATVAGGGWNTASGEYSTIGGGSSNTASGDGATVAGGCSNFASAYRSTVGGGWGNSSTSSFTTVGGGLLNSANSFYATVGGGDENTASGVCATIPGGQWDTVAGDFSFATGKRVRLTSDADYTFAFGNDFTTSTPHAVVFCDSVSEMKVGIQTTSPTARLDVSGSTGYNQVRMRTSYTPTGTSDANGNVGDIAWDDDYFYVKTSAGWKRVALSTW